MNLKTKGSTALQEIKILDRKTDDYGRTLYLVNWGQHAPGRGASVWERMNNLKYHYSIIREFQKNYQERVKNWNEQVEIYDACANSGINSLCQNKEEGKMQNTEKLFKQPQNSISEQNKQSSDSSLNDQCLKISPTPEQTPTIINMDTQKNSAVSSDNQQADRQQPAEEENKEVAIRLKQNVRSIAVGLREMSVRRKNKLKRRQEQIKLQKIIEIVDIVVDNTVWYAVVRFQNIGEKIVLRDWLKLEHPQMLMLFYERLVELKKTDFAHKF